VITSDRSSMPEVAGDAALLVNPESVEEIVVAMEQIASDRQVQMRLRAAGPIQAARFSWKQTAEESYRAYEQALVAD
jgi:glycosyltransferase involved in cell wall biosynthesis